MAFIKQCLLLFLVTCLVCSCNESNQKQPLTGMPAVRDSSNIYADANAGMFSPVARSAIPRVYVPNSLSNTLSVIDPATYQVIGTFKTGRNPQHVVPSYDMKTLWILNDKSSTAIPIDPNTGKLGTAVPIDDPYNLYFTPDGRYAIGVDEAKRRFDFRDPQTLTLIESVPVACKGLNHMDFTADGHAAVATCEFSGQLVKLNIATHQIEGYLRLSLDMPATGSMPQDIRLSPDGKIFYVADMTRGGVFLIDAKAFAQIGFIATGIGTHSIFPSRDGKLFYIGNRGCRGLGCHLPSYCSSHGPGSITVLDPIKRVVIANWPIPGGGSPDMGNVSADGKEFWISGRYDSEVYVFDTTTGALTHRIPVGSSPHGLAIWPLPGRYSLGHTGNMR